MNQKEKNARRLVRQANGLSPGFRYFDNPYEDETMDCPGCGKTIASGLKTCPECGNPIPGARRSREKARTSPGVMLLMILFAALLVLVMYFFLREVIESGFMALLLGQ